MKRRVAVLGAGFQGTCLALELAHRGVRVDLYDRNSQCMTQAGSRNEGKIHLGFVYANDPSFETARLMVRGALTFGACVRRWIGVDLEAIGLSTPFDYVVHRKSMVCTQQIEAHFAKVDAFLREVTAATGQRYLDHDGGPVFRSPPAHLTARHDPTVVAAVISTAECAINVPRLTARLRERVAEEPRISFRSDAVVAAVEPNGDGFHVRCTSDDRSGGLYRQVVNCLWDGRLAIDTLMGMRPSRPWLHRLKFGIRLALERDIDESPSVTIVLGRYGDVVQFSRREFYLSWYPACLAGISGDLAPPDWPRELSGDAARSLIARSLQGLSSVVPALRAFDCDDIEQATVSGGIIVAAGRTDIDDPRSGLHERTAVGIRSCGGYHSVDPGKFSLAPLFAVEAANRVCLQM